MWRLAYVYPAFLLVALFIYKVYKESKPREIKGRHVCITGGSSGIGKSLAILAAKYGAHVTIIARNEQRLKTAMEEIKNCRVLKEQQFHYQSLDCTNYEDTQRVIKEVDAALPIYMMVNCAGMAIASEFDNVTEEEIKQMIDVNYYSAVFPLKAVVPLMRKRKEGILVLTSSQGGLIGLYGYTIYAAAKFALRGFAEALQMEVADDNISVTLAVPPDTDTPGFEVENRRKPLATKMLSEDGGLFKPKQVAERMLYDAMAGHFFSHIGLESWMLTTLTVGMAPFNDYFDVLAHSMLLGVLRLVSIFYIKSFQNIVTRCKMNEMKEKAE